MSEQQGISRESFAALVERAGLGLTSEEIETLRPMYDFFAQQVAPIHDVELDAEDLAVVYSPNWDPR